MWTDLETVDTPDLPAAKAALEAARKPYTDALQRWNTQAAQTAERMGWPEPRSEYRVKLSPCGTKATVQRRDV